MGSAGSKAAQKGARKFPTRPPGTSPPPPPSRHPSHPATRPPRAPQEPAVPSPKASYSKDQAIRADGGDPQQPFPSSPSELANPAFSARLRQMGVVQPNPTFSPSSTAGTSGVSSAPPSPSPSAPAYPSSFDNAILGVLEARRRLQERAEQEQEGLGRRGSGGREFLDVGTIRGVLALRQRGVAPADVEARLGLKAGVVDRLGRPGVVSNAAEVEG